jgi:hypothetical protein
MNLGNFCYFQHNLDILLYSAMHYFGVCENQNYFWRRCQYTIDLTSLPKVTPNYYLGVSK